ncbi:MAG: ATP synthase F1 subunit gamma [Planctomycetia bacterium]|nr:ATP synthase F1 subunit gamma [Planctomycetia bacterium]
MVNPRALDRRRRSIRSIRKITRTMELIATARFKKAMDRASAATAYTRRITQLVAKLAQSGLEVSHPLLQPRPEIKHAKLLVITSNRGYCGGYNGNVVRAAAARWNDLASAAPKRSLEVSGKRGIGAFKYRGQAADVTFTHFEDKPTFAEVDVLATRYLDEYVTGQIDRLDVAYTVFQSAGRQAATVETLLPLSSLAGSGKPAAGAEAHGPTKMYEFLPSAKSILEEIVPTSFKVKVFKCFLDAAVSEQIARMVAMKAATENADKLIKTLSRHYNRARQGRITSELLDVIGGVEALKG